jgi:phosphoglycolate phosphatase
VRPTVLLFDIDGTILETRGAARGAIVRAFAQVYARPDACDAIAFGGMTDRAIARQGLEAIGAPSDEASIDAILAIYLDGLEDAMARAEHVRVHDGIVAAVDAGLARERCAVGLGTGNVERGARIKLRRVGLSDRFAFGGFGCDHEDRAELLRRGAARGAAALGAPAGECRVVIIGDTPKDIAAARAIGAESIAVATGSFREEDLAPHGPTWVFRDMTQPGALAALLAG